VRFFALLGLVALAGCSRSAPSPTTGTTREAIIGGKLDSAHQAVVALKLVTAGSPVFGRCSGTIVKVEGTTGTVITSAHCFEDGPTKVTITSGPDFNAPQATFTATSWTVFPTAGGKVDPHRDLALVKFEGVNASTPVVALTPAATYATYTKGSPFTVVGYGRVDADGDIPNTQRKNLDLTLSEFEESWLINTSPTGSTCFGDSGGAVLDKSSGTEKLAGVTQGGNCLAGDVNASVGFYQPEITAWLRQNGFDEADATKLPDNADCTTDSQCASGACQDFISDDTGALIVLCGPPNENGFSCTRPAQCKSGLCDHLVCKDPASDGGASSSGSSGPSTTSTSSSGDIDAGADAGPAAASKDDGCASTSGDVTPAALPLAIFGLALVMRRRRKIA
jgi:MYXO-CTERM domain-containing protein